MRRITIGLVTWLVLSVRVVAGDLQIGTTAMGTRDGSSSTDAKQEAVSAADPLAPTAPRVARNAQGQIALNRFLPIQGQNPGIATAIRVTFVELPPPFDIWNGAKLWVGPPSKVSNRSTIIAEDPDFPIFTEFKAATLQCSPFFTGWSIHGTVYVFHEGIVPKQRDPTTSDNFIGRYTIEEAWIVPGESDPTFSAPVTVTTAIWGDTLGTGSVNISDILAVIKRFSNASDAFIKPKGDLEPGCLDLLINVSDALDSIRGFSGLTYRFTPTAAAPCDSTCENPLP